MTSTLTPGTAAGFPARRQPSPRPTAPHQPAPSAILVTEAITGIHRVERDGATIGYVQETGQRFVSLLGRVYNTSVEVSQSLTLDDAVRRLLAL